MVKIRVLLGPDKEEGQTESLPFFFTSTPLRSQYSLSPHPDLLRIGDSQNLEIHISEVDRVEGVVLPGDDEYRRADDEVYAIIRKEDELSGVQTYF